MLRASLTPEDLLERDAPATAMRSVRCSSAAITRSEFSPNG